MFTGLKNKKINKKRSQSYINTRVSGYFTSFILLHPQKWTCCALRYLVGDVTRKQENVFVFFKSSLNVALHLEASLIDPTWEQADESEKNLS